MSYICHLLTNVNTFCRAPTRQPSSQPTNQPTNQPSAQPTRQPSSQPSRTPTAQPSRDPTRSTFKPTRRPVGDCGDLYVKTPAGNGCPTYCDDAEFLATFKYPDGVAIDEIAEEFIIITDRGNNKIRKMIISSGVVTTIASSKFLIYFFIPSLTKVYFSILLFVNRL